MDVCGRWILKGLGLLLFFCGQNSFALVCGPTQQKLWVYRDNDHDKFTAKLPEEICLSYGAKGLPAYTYLQPTQWGDCNDQSALEKPVPTPYYDQDGDGYHVKSVSPYTCLEVNKMGGYRTNVGKGLDLNDNESDIGSTVPANKIVCDLVKYYDRASIYNPKFRGYEPKPSVLDLKRVVFSELQTRPLSGGSTADESGLTQPEFGVTDLSVIQPCEEFLYKKESANYVSKTTNRLNGVIPSGVYFKAWSDLFTTRAVAEGLVIAKRLAASSKQKDREALGEEISEYVEAVLPELMNQYYIDWFGDRGVMWTLQGLLERENVRRGLGASYEGPSMFTGGGELSPEEKCANESAEKLANARKENTSLKGYLKSVAMIALRRA